MIQEGFRSHRRLSRARAAGSQTPSPRSRASPVRYAASMVLPSRAPRASPAAPSRRSLSSTGLAQRQNNRRAREAVVEEPCLIASWILAIMQRRHRRCVKDQRAAWGRPRTPGSSRPRWLASIIPSVSSIKRIIVKATRTSAPCVSMITLGGLSRSIRERSLTRCQRRPRVPWQSTYFNRARRFFRVETAGPRIRRHDRNRGDP